VDQASIARSTIVWLLRSTILATTLSRLGHLRHHREPVMAFVVLERASQQKTDINGVGMKSPVVRVEAKPEFVVEVEVAGDRPNDGFIRYKNIMVMVLVCSPLHAVSSYCACCLD
jgi:hypothetical protein